MNRDQPLFELRTVKELGDNYHFYIASYQRGYKWTSIQVQDLLNDIDEFDFNKDEAKFYCLQPLAVKKEHNSDKFEVIDGQQRLTTIYLILKAIDKNRSHYSITYDTRESSADFLKDIDAKIDRSISEWAVLSKIDFNELTNKINESWSYYIKELSDSDAKLNNVDNYHFFGAYLTIHNWFKLKSDQEKELFKTKLLEHTRFIWYEDKSDKDAKRLFRDLNSGKIELTQAELIKALFVNAIKHSNKEILQMKQTEFAAEWDLIETTLQNNEFWYFINTSADYFTRIDFLFEILEGVKEKNDDKHYLYRIYAQKAKQNDLNWDKVKELFLTLRDWYEDSEIYHTIGFLISSEIKNIKSIYDESIGKQKSTFKKILKKYIFSEIKTKTNNQGELIYDLNKLSYQNKKDKQRMKTLLLLHNIIAYQRSEAKYKFPFEQFKNEKWSLEHIHAQNAKEFSTVEQIKVWLTDIKQLIASFQSSGIFIDKIEIEGLEELSKELEELDGEKAISENQSKIRNQIAENIESFFDVHSISNMALLDCNTNSALNNNPFSEKRKIIIEIDKKGWVDINGNKRKAFVPLCTRNVFLKYYSQTIEQMELWGGQDRIDYKKAIDNDINDSLEVIEDGKPN